MAISTWIDIISSQVFDKPFSHCWFCSSSASSGVSATLDFVRERVEVLDLVWASLRWLPGFCIFYRLFLLPVRFQHFHCLFQRYRLGIGPFGQRHWFCHPSRMDQTVLSGFADSRPFRDVYRVPSIRVWSGLV